jgi:hypothetical protein
MRGDSGREVFPAGTTLTILPLDALDATILQIH